MSDVILVAVIAAAPGILAAIVSFFNNRDIKRTHNLVNSRMTELLDLTRTASRAEGVKEQKDKGSRDV